MSTPTVSVLMTAYNRERYIAEAIQSVLESTYRDFELIIVDDGSTDRTVEIAREFEQTDSRVAVHVNDENLGDYPNRNQAASHASGEYLKYVDADDYLYPTGLQVLVEMMGQFPDAGYGLCSLDSDSRGPYPFSLTPVEAYRRHYFGNSLFSRAPLSAIIRRAAFEKVGGFPPNRMVGDFAMWHRLSTSFDVVLMPHAIAWYRTHDAQEMNDVAREPLRYALKYESVSISALEADDCPLDWGEVRTILKRYFKSNSRRLAKQLIQVRFAEVSLVLTQLRRIRTLLGGKIASPHSQMPYPSAGDSPR